MPKVSVIMPVYNAAKYLHKAIDSVLNQHYKNLELIVVNDCSTDDSKQVILSYVDDRIVYHELKTNSGVVTAMNAGLALVKSELVAVMHADDISVKDRLEKQVDYMQANPQTAVVAGFITNINEADMPTGQWDRDRQVISPSQIKAGMVLGNCIAHPTVMMRTEIVRRYGYTSSPEHVGYAVEDYPLWLHLLADGFMIDKLPEPLLLYRVHSLSATGTFLKKRNPFVVNYLSKKHFLAERKQAGKWTDFDRKVQRSMYLDLVMGKLKNLKRKLLP